MSIRILAVGRKHEDWVETGIERYQKRLRKPYDVSWQLLPHSQRENLRAREEESVRLLEKIKPNEFVILLDERGKDVPSPDFSKVLSGGLVRGNLTMIIGGAYGVDDSVRNRADFVWSLSKLVFPHQLVRLIVCEQIYRAQEILSGGQYHHD